MRAELDNEAGQVLLQIARAAISRELGVQQEMHEDAQWLHDQGACFVTLRQAEDLRGCIGTLRAHRPLVEDVKANALGAAFRDPRFSPLVARELEITRVEVSLLSQVEELTCKREREALAKLRPGIDGVIFEYGYHHSTFLPQVWAELPDPADFVAHLKQKAGLPPDFWDPEVKLGRYTVSKWCEQ
jgi:AmmeMemoRadiSam system protein A